MKRLLLSGLILMAFGQVPADAQTKKRVTDDIYYNADDAKKDAEETAAQQRAYEEARSKQNAEEEANRTTGDYELDYTGEESEYIDYDDDDYTYSNRFNRFNNPYYGGSYWGYDPWMMGGGYWGGGWGPGFGMSVGFGSPYWTSYWGWNSWYGYPGFYSVWNSPYVGWGYGGWGYGGGFGGGYYNGFYDGFYAGAYNNGGITRNVTYGPRTSLNRYPGSTRGTMTRGTTIGGNNNPGQLRRGSEMRAPGTTNSRNNYPSRTAPATGGRSTERSTGTPARGNMGGVENRGNYQNNSSPNYRNNAPGVNNPGRGNVQQQQRVEQSYQQAEPAQQRAQPSQQRAEPVQQRAQPSYQRAEPSNQRSQPAYSAPSRSSSPTYSAPSRGGGGGGFSGGSRGGGGRR